MVYNEPSVRKSGLSDSSRFGGTMTDLALTRDVLFELTGVGVVETDLRTGRLVQANPTFCELVGYTEAELRKLTYLELTHPGDRERDAERFAALRRGESRGGEALTRVLCKDGRVVRLELHVTVVGEGPEARNLTVATDVTRRERRSAEASDNAAERNLTEEQVHRAIREVLSDADWFKREVMARLAHAKTGNAGVYEPVELTKREREVLGRIALGVNNPAIADELGVATQTVRNYVAAVYDKLGVHSRAEAVVWARERGIVGEGLA